MDSATVQGSVGKVEIKTFAFDGLALDCGETLVNPQVAYETYGKLNDECTNAILITHAFSGDANAAGYHEDPKRPGWWNNMIGPGKAFDTNKYFIVCSNVIGGCMGSTGPASINPDTGKPYGLNFPVVSIRDMVNAQYQLMKHLGLASWLSIAGGSMGGMQALQWMHSYPGCLRSAIPIATTLKHSPQQIAFNEVGRQAIMSDLNWADGDYYNKELPGRGLSVARMIGHITYMSDHSMREKFGRKVKLETKSGSFSPHFEVQGYLQYRGSTFVNRFDANSYLYITRAMDYFDLTAQEKSTPLLSNLDAKVLVLSFDSDWLYPSYQSQEIVRLCKLSGVRATYVEIDSTYGHDAFLLEIEKQSQLISHFLRSV